MGYTPMMQQYIDIKKEYIDAILFFRLGDFYEMFFNDAITASKVLEITLTGRDAGQKERVPMCGIPYHAAEVYISKLIQKGYKVAICEQIENPASVKGIVKREVLRVITPGTVIENSSLDEKSYNYLVSIAITSQGYGLAFADISTGLFQCTQFAGRDQTPQLLDELTRLNPAEIIIPQSLKGQELHEKLNLLNSIATLTFYNNSHFERTKCLQKLYSISANQWQYILDNCPLAVTACGSLLAYLQETHKKEAQIKNIVFYSGSQYVMIDRSTRKNLELTASMKDNGRYGSLVWVLDRTKTAMGGRMIKTWIEQPLTDINMINLRLDALEELKNDIILRHDLKNILINLYDLERIASRVVYGTANARDLIALRNSLELIPSLANRLQGLKSYLFVKQVCNQIDNFNDIVELLQSSIDNDPPGSVRDGRIIKEGYNQEVDDLRRAQKNGKSWLTRLEAEERQNSGIRSLKIGFNKVFGYYLEVTKANINLVPDYFIRKQTLTNAERYITPKLKELEELILSAGDKLIQLEYNIFNVIREKVSASVNRIQRTSKAIALVDVILSFAEAAVEENYNRPKILESNNIYIKCGRHPVVEKVMGSEQFVPNDTEIEENNKVILLTGPNMAGKSTYMRQVALLVLMAQMGCFIPAEDSEIGIVDKLYTRIGAADDLAGGQSTFMVEMNECKNIISNATNKSLVLMDEVGRGTSTYDGISIARALVEYIVKHIECRTLFSTHYHELTDLELLTEVKNYTITVKEQDQKIIFLRKVIPGKADRSYGIHVAALAGLPDSVITRARELLAELESTKSTASHTANVINDTYFSKEKSDKDKKIEGIIKELSEIDIVNITPIKALNLLAKFKSTIP